MVPFTLQLRYGSSGYKQEVSLGIDAGTKHIGVSATTEKAVLFEAEAQPRTDIQEGYLLHAVSSAVRGEIAKPAIGRVGCWIEESRRAGWPLPFDIWSKRI